MTATMKDILTPRRQFLNDVARERGELEPFQRNCEKGGPTEENPNRPYCKPDQSCCDFVCGN